MIALIDYGLGNIQAFLNVYRRLGVEAVPVQSATELRQATRIILPGVGAFDWAMQRLNASGLRAMLDEMVLERKVPTLGVCVGMQMMACRSDEGTEAGLGWIKGEVRRLEASGDTNRMVLPHMGWNDVSPVHRGGLFRDLEAPRFYFLHSYYFAPESLQDIAATTVYGIPFASSVNAGNVYGTQFHPEKSHTWGIRLLRNFGEAC